MVVLNRIYTRTGDKGDTALGSGERVPKTHLRIQAYGTVDETNAAVGLARLHTEGISPTLDEMLARIQNDLFDLGADLCVPDTGKELGYEPLRMTRNRRSGSKPRSTSSMPSFSRCAPSCCRAAIRRRPIFISPHRVPARRAPHRRARRQPG